jgi:hypothetical protein
MRLKKNRKYKSIPKAGTMLQQKTNEDFNKKPPASNDVTGKDKSSGTETPVVGNDAKSDKTQQ